MTTRSRGRSRRIEPSPTAQATDTARAMDSLRRIVHALRVATRASERAFGLGGAQLFVLRQLSAKSGQSLSDLAARTHTTQSSISEVVTRLVRNGLVSRAPSSIDRRRTVLSLTAEGETLLGNAPETIQERLLHGLESLDEGTRQHWPTASNRGSRARASTTSPPRSSSSGPALAIPRHARDDKRAMMHPHHCPRSVA